MYLAYTLKQFCELHNISRTTFWKLGKDRPAIMRAGRRILISIEAAEAWRREMEARSAARLTPAASKPDAARPVPSA